LILLILLNSQTFVSPGADRDEVPADALESEAANWNFCVTHPDWQILCIMLGMGSRSLEAVHET
jgi:hypothetical protein